MPARAAELPTADEEIALVRLAVQEALCSVESLAAFLGQPRSTVACWVGGQRRAPPGLLLATLRHLGADAPRLLAQLAARYDPGAQVVSLAEVRRRQEIAETAARLAHLTAADARRAA